MIGRRARFLGRVLVASLLLAGLGPVLAGEASAVAPTALQQDEIDDGDETTPTTPPTTLLPPRDDSIIVKPNTGDSPEDAGDRGGGLQVAVLLAVLVGIAGVGALGLRESRRNRSRAS